MRAHCNMLIQLENSLNNMKECAVADEELGLAAFGPTAQIKTEWWEYDILYSTELHVIAGRNELTS